MKVAFESISASDKTLVYDHETRSNEIVNVPIVTLYYDESNLVPPSTTTTIGLFTRDPIGFDGGDNFYVYWNSLRDSDPSGLSPFNCTSQKISLNFPSALGKMGSIGDLLAKLQRFSDNEKLKGILPCSLKLNGSLAFEHSSCQSCCDKGGAGDKGHFTLSGSAGVGVSCTSNGGVGLYTTVSGSLDVNVYFERKWDTCVPKDEANACLTLNGSLSWSVCTGLAAIGTRACVKISVDCKGGYCINAHNLTGGWTGGCKVRVSGDACAFFQCVGGSFPPIFEFP